MSQTFKLYRLQQIDSQLDHTRLRLSEIETAINNDAAFRQAEMITEAAQAEWQAARKALQLTEQAVKDQRIKIEQIESTLYSGKVHNPKELQDMQNDVAALKRYRSVLEDRQIEAMITDEEKQSQLQTAAKNMEAVKQQSNTNKAEWITEQSRLQREAAHLEDERRAAAATIPAQDLQLYEQLRKQRAGVAVAKISDRACAACGSVLSTALLAAVRTPSQIARCETCGRILYTG